jgi:hypothetical protein
LLYRKKRRLRLLLKGHLDILIRSRVVNIFRKNFEKFFGHGQKIFSTANFILLLLILFSLFAISAAKENDIAERTYGQLNEL